jgi:cytochrome c556
MLALVPLGLGLGLGLEWPAVPSPDAGEPRAGWRAAGATGIAWADEQDLPAGPIRERHELMEEIGKQAKALNGALKAGGTAAVAPPAEAIARLAARIVKLFPEGSTHPKSRAKPEIWQKFDQFEALAGGLVTSSSALAVAAKAGADVQSLAAKVTRTCKACHENFRTPKKGE